MSIAAPTKSGSPSNGRAVAWANFLSQAGWNRRATSTNRVDRTSPPRIGERHAILREDLIRAVRYEVHRRIGAARDDGRAPACRSPLSVPRPPQAPFMGGSDRLGGRGEKEGCARRSCRSSACAANTGPAPRSRPCCAPSLIRKCLHQKRLRDRVDAPRVPWLGGMARARVQASGRKTPVFSKPPITASPRSDLCRRIAFD